MKQLLPAWTRWMIYPLLALVAGWRIVDVRAMDEPLNGFGVENSLIDVDRIEHGGPPRDGIPALSEPDLIGRHEADYLESDDRIIGITIGSSSRAYPIKILNHHELINDTVNGRQILVSYCPLCGSGIVFNRRVNSRALEFGVSGLLYNSDVLMYDRQTESLWSQLKMQAVTGPLAGTRLVALPAVHTTWSDWIAEQPATRVVSDSTGYRRDYQRDPYKSYRTSPGVWFQLEHRDSRLPAKEPVWGVILGDLARAWPRSMLPTESSGFADQIGETAIQVRWHADADRLQVTTEDGALLPVITGYYFAWMAFYPESSVFGLENLELRPPGQD